jgi:16S rRNA (uracil1498-N3)-methyltransferase
VSPAAPAGAPYFLVENLPAPGLFTLDGAEGRHASTVRRLRIGEHVVLTDGAGRAASATVVGVGRGSIDVQVGSPVDVSPVAVRVTVVQALPKGERSDLAVELATEAGVDAIVPWAASRCVALWTGDKADRGRARWRSVATQAAKQSRRATVPPVAALASTSDVVRLIGDSDAALVLHEAGSVPITEVPMPSAGSLVVIIGPEGGVSPDELTAFQDAGAHVVRLGPEVLRTSTAAAVALGALGVLAGRWSRPAGDAPNEDPAVPARQVP